MIGTLGILLTAWILEIVFSWPDWLYKKIRHPVVWLGALINLLDQIGNRSSLPHCLRYILGMVSSLSIVVVTTGFAWIISNVLPETPVKWLFETILISSLIASRSLYTHVQNVLFPLQDNDILSARTAASQIVGRDTSKFDASDISRASLESLAENASDGVIAPIFWCAFFGLPGIVAYKTINTLDSMIGHKNERYLAFGGFAARMDDIANFIPARITGSLFAIVSLNYRAFLTMLKDASFHRSPNAGWPESAMAAGLGVNLSGPRIYNGVQTSDKRLNAEGRDPEPKDIKHGLVLYRNAMILMASLLAITYLWMALR